MIYVEICSDCPQKPERLEIASTIVGVSIDWELFTDQIQRVPATATDPAGPLPTFLTSEDNIHTWTNYLKNFKLPTVQQIDVQVPSGNCASR